MKILLKQIKSNINIIYQIILKQYLENVNVVNQNN